MNTSIVKLSIRRKDAIGLPGDDPTLFNIKLGSSLKGGSPLRGLTHEEERKYMPEIIGFDPSDVKWRQATKNYWNNISVIIPADGLNADELQGKILTFTVDFKHKDDKDKFDSLSDFEEKALLLTQLDSQNKITLIEGVENYVLFQFAIKSSSVANRVKDQNKSPKIKFYLYSKAIEVKAKHILFKLRNEARNAFFNVIEDETIINALLTLFGQSSDTFKDLESKHLALETYVDKYPKQFLSYINDADLKIKSIISKAARFDIVHQPSNSSTYYYGDNNEVVLGNNIDEAVLFLKDQKNAEIAKSIIARLKIIN